jgi:hypothetical protein
MRRALIACALLLVAGIAAAQPFTQGRLWRVSKAGVPDS